MNCLLCNKEMKKIIQGSDIVFCATTVTIGSETVNHYQKIYNMYILYTLPFRLSKLGENVLIERVLHWTEMKGEGDCSEWTWKKIAMVPQFEIKSEENVRRKIQTIITFS